MFGTSDSANLECIQAMALVTLKKRQDFLRVRGGRRWSTKAFLLEGKPRDSSICDSPTARFGFTVTKKMGNAVARNRIRRRLRAAVDGLAPAHADPTFDYVVLARKPAIDRAFDALCSDFEVAFERIHKARSRKTTGGGRQRP